MKGALYGARISLSHAGEKKQPHLGQHLYQM